ncbi:MAG: LysE family translocator [Ornithinibacter sp.]
MGSDVMPLVVLTAMVMAVPGPSVAFAVTQRIQGGPAVGAWGVIGLETGLLVHVTACVLGVSALIAASPATLTAIKVGGATYLAILGGRQVMASRHADAVRPAAARRRTSGGAGTTVRSGRGRAFRGGMLVDLLNPKTVTFVVALLPQFLQSDQGRWQPVLAGGIVVALGLAADLTWMLLAGWLWSDRPSARRERWTHAATGTAFLGFACVLAAH